MQKDQDPGLPIDVLTDDSVSLQVTHTFGHGARKASDGEQRALRSLS